jgi:hypothetical protein
MVFTTNIWADLSVRYYSIGKNYKTPLAEVLIKQDQVRINLTPQSERSLLLNLTSGDMAQVDMKNARYFQINAQTLSGYAAFYHTNKTLLQGLIDNVLRQLNPQERDQVLQFLQGYDQAHKTLKRITVKPTRKTDIVLGVECQVIAIFNKQRLEREVCISNYRQLGLNPADIHSIEQLKRFIQQFKSSAPKQQQDMLEPLSNALAQTNGLPMKMITYKPDGTVESIVQAGTISLKRIPVYSYLIPEHYKQENLPLL